MMLEKDIESTVSLSVGRQREPTSKVQTLLPASQKQGQKGPKKYGASQAVSCDICPGGLPSLKQKAFLCFSKIGKYKDRLPVPAFLGENVNLQGCINSTFFELKK